MTEKRFGMVSAGGASSEKHLTQAGRGFVSLCGINPVSWPWVARGIFDAADAEFMGVCAACVKEAQSREEADDGS